MIQTSYLWRKIFIKCHIVDFLLKEARFADNTYFNTYFVFSSNSVNWTAAKWTLASIIPVYPFWYVLCGKQPRLSCTAAADFYTVTDSITVCMSIFDKWTVTSRNSFSQWSSSSRFFCPISISSNLNILIKFVTKKAAYI